MVGLSFLSSFIALGSEMDSLCGAGNLLCKLQKDFRQARERVGHCLEVILDVAQRHALNALE